MTCPMTILEAIARLSQEIYLFSDRPDYVTPQAVEDARQVLEEVFIFKTDALRSYPEDEDIDDKS